MNKIGQEVEDNIYITIMKLDGNPQGFVYVCNSGHYHIIVDSCLNFEQQKQVVRHEMEHIQKHLPKYPHIITLNQQHSKIEREVSLFFNPTNGKIISK